MRVLVVDDSAPRAELLRAALREAGYELTAPLGSPLALLKAIEDVEPDVVVIDTESPSRDVLEHLLLVSRHAPRPVVIFTSDAAPEKILEALRVGASACVVGGLLQELQSLRTQLAEANSRLAERKLVERAKGLLMKSRGLDEEAAYAALRKMAMDRKLRLAEVAQRVVDAADLLGA